MRIHQEQLARELLPGSLALFFAGTEKDDRLRKGWLGSFQQDPYFLYLLNFSERDSLFILRKSSGGEVERLLFCREKDADYERWHGQLLGPEAAKRQLELDKAFPYQEVEKRLEGLFEGIQHLYLVEPCRIPSWFHHGLLRILASRTSKIQLHSLKAGLDRARRRKIQEEVELISEACRITSVAFTSLLEDWGEIHAEYEVQASLYRDYLSLGSSPAYPAIVAAGARGNCLHYNENKESFRGSELVLIDSGCQFEGYASDVTRTFPCSGKFSRVQEEIYTLVLEAQEAAISKAYVGSSFLEMEQAARTVIREGLVDCGLIPRSEGQHEGAERPFFMHSIGHWIGLEVHDVGARYHEEDGKPTLFEPGMVLTVEPGIYLPDDAERFGDFSGICVRIEDVLVIKPQGNEVLTESIPKTVSLIEQHCC